MFVIVIKTLLHTAVLIFSLECQKLHTRLNILLDANRRPPPLINFLKFFHPGHSYSRTLSFQFFSIQDILKCEYSLRTKNILKETLAL